jgi:hypothetical protein
MVGGTERVGNLTADWHLFWQGRDHHWGTAGVSFDDAFRNALDQAAQVLSQGTTSAK